MSGRPIKRTLRGATDNPGVRQIAPTPTRLEAILLVL